MTNLNENIKDLKIKEPMSEVRVYLKTKDNKLIRQI